MFKVEAAAQRAMQTEAIEMDSARTMSMQTSTRKMALMQMEAIEMDKTRTLDMAAGGMGFGAFATKIGRAGRGLAMASMFVDDDTGKLMKIGVGVDMVAAGWGRAAEAVKAYGVAQSLATGSILAGAAAVTAYIVSAINSYKEQEVALRAMLESSLENVSWRRAPKVETTEQGETYQHQLDQALTARSRLESKRAELSTGPSTGDKLEDVGDKIYNLSLQTPGRNEIKRQGALDANATELNAVNLDVSRLQTLAQAQQATAAHTTEMEQLEKAAVDGWQAVVDKAKAIADSEDKAAKLIDELFAKNAEEMKRNMDEMLKPFQNSADFAKGEMDALKTPQERLREMRDKIDHAVTIGNLTEAEAEVWRNAHPNALANINQTVAGTFSSSVGWGMAGRSGPAEETAKSVKEMSDTLRSVDGHLEKLEDNVMVYLA